MSEIEKYYNGEIHVDFEEDKPLNYDEIFTEWVGIGYDAYKINYKKEYIRLKSIIKEVREYIEENTNSDSFTVLTSGKITDIAYCIVAFEDILEILDKENKDGER